MNVPSPFYRVSLKALIFDTEKRLLVVQTADKLWELPGGGWEHGESMQNCLRRELVEELGAGVTHINFKQIYPYSSPTDRGHVSLKLAMPVTLDDQELTPSDGMIAYRFVTPQQLSKLSMQDEEAGIKNHIDRIWRTTG